MQAGLFVHASPSAASGHLGLDLLALGRDLNGLRHVMDEWRGLKNLRQAATDMGPLLKQLLHRHLFALFTARDMCLAGIYELLCWRNATTFLLGSGKGERKPSAIAA
jgi:hypothetical protein